MRSLKSFALAATAVLGLAVTGQALAATLPSQDPFYARPAYTPAVPHGTILATRPVTLVFPTASSATQIKYVTQNEHDQPVVAIATLIVPLTPPLSSGARPLLAYNYAIDSLSLDCNPSYTLQGGYNTTGNNLNGFAEMPLIEMALQAGWAVVVSDHEGLDMNWTVTKMSGQAVLDGIRAARSYGPAALSGSPLGMWGYSGGAQATVRAAELASSYAPELSFKGIAAGGVPVDMMHIARKVDGGTWSGAELDAIFGQMRAWPEYNMQQYISAAGWQLQQKISKECFGNLLGSDYSNKKLADYSTVADPLSVPAAKTITDFSRLGQGKPAGPMYIYQSIWDEFISYEDVTGLVNQYCGQGVPVTFNLDQTQYLNEHISYSAVGAPGAFVFLQSAFAGLPAPSTCGLPTQPAPASGSSGACNPMDPTSWAACGGSIGGGSTGGSCNYLDPTTWASCGTGTGTGSSGGACNYANPSTWASCAAGYSSGAGGSGGSCSYTDPSTWAHCGSGYGG